MTIRHVLLLALLAAPAAFPAAAALPWCGAAAVPLTFSPTGDGASSYPLITATFRDADIFCGYASASIVLDGVPLPTGAYEYWDGLTYTYVLEAYSFAALLPGLHTASATVVEYGGSPGSSVAWTFYVGPADATSPDVAPQRASATLPASVSVPTIYTTPAISTPGLAPMRVGTDPTTLARQCTAADIVCAGPFTVPAQTVGYTPAVASVGILGPTPLPPATVIGLPDSGSASATTGASGYHTSVSPSRTTSFGPYEPLSSVPITICASTCVLPDPVDAYAVARVTVGVSTGTVDFSRTVGVDTRTILP